MTDTVWVVEDDRALLDGLVRLLREHGLSARGFTDPERALSAALESPPHVLVTDLAMPHLTGVELAQSLRERLAGACPRIVLITGSELRRVELTLFDHVARKPFRFEAVLEKVKSFLRPRRARRVASHLRLRQTSAHTRSSGGHRG